MFFRCSNLFQSAILIRYTRDKLLYLTGKKVLFMALKAIKKQASISLTAHMLSNPLNPFPWYQIMREQQPVYYSPELKSWCLAAYNDVLYVIDNPQLFSSEQSLRSRPQNMQSAPDGQINQKTSARTLLWTDPPRHRQLRSLISQAFTPRTIANLAPRMTQIVHAYVDRIATSKTIDIIQDLANPLPLIVIAELVGVPARDQQQFKYWSDIIVSPGHRQKKQAVREMNAYFLTIVEQRRSQPQEDLISALLAAQIDADSLTEGEILSFCRLLLVAGHETSTNLIGNALLTLTEYPDVLQALYTAPELIPATIEEVMRYRSPIQRLRRAATQTTIIGGNEIKAGDIVSPILGSANRDASQFEHPELFDIFRTPNKHIAFGHGIHFCIGSSLARLEAKIALEVLFERCRNLRRIDNTPLQAVDSAFVYGVKSLPLTFK